MKERVPLPSAAVSSLDGGFSGDFAGGLDRMLWGFEQGPGLNAQRLRQSLDVGQGDVPAAALDR